MSTLNRVSLPGLTRRDFLKMAGMTTAALMVPGFFSGCGYTANPGAASMSAAVQKSINTDILVIGGGMAGTFAAVAAKEQGLNVTLVDKGTVGRSGATPWANGMSVFDEALGHNRAEWIANVSRSSEYVNNRDWLEQMLDNSKTRWDDVVSWGMTRADVRHPSLVLREKLVDSGVELIERTMMTTLLTQDGKDGSRVVGAMGFSLDTEEAVVVLAKATIMCAGAGAFKAPGFPIHSLTSDGDAMAYRVGAIISGKEWIDFHWTNTENPASCWSQWGGMWNSGLAKESIVFTAGMTLDSAFSIHTGETFSNIAGGPPPGGPPPAGADSGNVPPGPPPGGPPPDGAGNADAPPGPPPGMGGGTRVLGAATGLGIHKAEGIWPTNMQGASNIPGLFAAGDGLASMLCGASYTGLGMSLMGSATQGYAAGQGAAEYARQVAAPTLPDDVIASAQAAMFAPRERESGFSPAWVTQVMQNTMFPYFVLLVKHEDRLKAALSTITFLREHIAPRLTAKDAHDLRLAHETQNMLLNAEMKLRASLFRTESRGTHYREDYPARNDDEWLAWVLLQKGPDGHMTVTKKFIPEAWKPDMSIPYEERYPNRFPGELEYLGLA
ncbi:MAG: FAD-dependent oxidoreductase [Chloroflexi bacterium]|nr:MAG: FAD-dependent oxidoreductase [Chloroflexota bacterium]